MVDRRDWCGMASAVAAVTVVLLAATVAQAVDGVVEINQACAINGGCTPFDIPGFPVTIRQGSYRLTSDLNFSEPSTIGIEIVSSNATLDFNGFKLAGSPDAGVIQTGVQGGSFNVVTNGRIEDVDGPCISLGDHARVENMMVLGCGGPGIHVGEHGIVHKNTIFQGASAGQAAALDMGASTGYSGNQISGTTAASVPVSGGVATGVNLCDGSPCTRFPPLRRYYLTKSAYIGSDALTACAEGFHMASLFEILDPTALEYDTTLGVTQDDSGKGPPIDAAYGGGWVRTGWFDRSTPDVGANCNSWTSGDSGHWGTVATPGWGSTSPKVGGWFIHHYEACNGPAPTWCIQD